MNHPPLTARARQGVWLVWLTAILLLGWALRAHELEVRSLWEDEGWTMLLSAGPGLDDVVRTLADDQHPPLYFMLLRLWRTAAGESEFTGRYLGVLAGVIAVAGTYQLGRALFSPLAGIWPPCCLPWPICPLTWRRKCVTTACC